MGKTDVFEKKDGVVRDLLDEKPKRTKKIFSKEQRTGLSQRMKNTSGKEKVFRK